MKFIDLVRSMKSRLDGKKKFKKIEVYAMERILAPVPAASDYSVSADLWQRLEDEIKLVSARIDAGDDLTPDDVVNVRKLKSEVDGYLVSFNKAMHDSQIKYKKMVEKGLVDIGFNTIEQFIAKKRQEQSILQNNRVALKMDKLKQISDDLLAKTEKLKEIPMSKELLPAFTARFPKVQSGAKSNDIMDWNPYIAIISRTIMIMDTFFCDPKYADAALLPLHSGTIRELLLFARDGKEEHIVNVPVKFKEDQPIIRVEKLKQCLTSKEDGIKYIRTVLADMEDMTGLSDPVKKVKTEQAWEEISLIVRLINS